MTRMIRKATMMTVGGLLLAGVALASVPTTDSVLPLGPLLGQNHELGKLNPTNTTRPSIMVGPYVSTSSPGLRPQLLGPTGPLFTFNITVKSSPTQVVPFSVVRIDFSACRKLFLANTNGNPVQPCLSHVVQVTADVNGVATFSIVGQSHN